MSYPTDPALYEYAVGPPDCPACFGADTSPVDLMVFIMGILPGQAFGPGDPAPPNGLWIAQLSTPCLWTILDIWDVTWRNIPLGTGLNIFHNVSLEIAFSANPIPNCVFDFTSSRADGPGVKYYGGTGIVVGALPSDGNSAQETMQLFNMDPTQEFFATTRTTADNHIVYTISKRIAKTNIKIKLLSA